MTKVLLAEDEPALLELFSDVVRRMGFECIRASDGGVAIDLALEHRPHLVITDYMMPERSGAEVIQAVRAAPTLAHVPVILMSAGRPPEEDRKQAWRFLRKPIDIQEFEGVIVEALAAAEAESATADRPAAGETSASLLGVVREEMLGWVAHEIKSPLSAALGATQLALRLLHEGGARETLEHRLRQNLRQLRRIDELVNALLDAAQLQDGKLELALSPLDVVQLVEKVAAYWRDTHPDATIEVRTSDPAAVIAGDAERLRQIVDNLVTNAVKYGRSTPIIIDVEAAPDAVYVRVSDSGRGIAASEIGQIFDRFHRVPGQGGRGHGLGLYIGAALARLHGGELTVTSEVGRGSTFTIRLPRAAPSYPDGLDSTSDVPQAIEADGAKY